MRMSERVKPIWNSRKLWRNEKVNEPHNVRNSAGFGSWIQTCHWQMFVTSFAVILAKWLDHLTHILCFTCVAGYGSKSLRITSNHGHLKDHEMCLEDSHTHVRWAKVSFFFSDCWCAATLRSSNLKETSKGNIRDVCVIFSVTAMICMDRLIGGWVKPY